MGTDIATAPHSKVTCPICDREIIPGESLEYNETGAASHSWCVQNHNNHEDAEESSPDTKNVIRQTVIEVLAECFEGVDFSFLDKMVEERIAAKLGDRDA